MEWEMDQREANAITLYRIIVLHLEITRILSFHLESHPEEVLSFFSNPSRRELLSVAVVLCRMFSDKPSLISQSNSLLETMFYVA
jgi:hypothetical protein